MNKYQCPVCSVAMAVGYSEKGPVDGIYIWCFNKKCSAEEVAGHGKDEKRAWEVVQEKFVKRENRE